jgi:hypothetical protein
MSSVDLTDAVQRASEIPIVSKYFRKRQGIGTYSISVIPVVKRNGKQTIELGLAFAAIAERARRAIELAVSNPKPG